MSFLTNWIFWTVLYLISAVLFAQLFKKVNRSMKNPTALTILLELFTAIFSLIFIFIFPIKIPAQLSTYIILLLVIILYAVTDRLNIEARYGLEPSTFSMMKQLSTVFIIVFGIFILKEEIIINKIIGAILIIIANVLLAYNKGKFQINKYFIMSIISNILFAVAMMININISDNFNIAIYTFITVFFPSIILIIFSRIKLRELKEEFKLYNKPKFLIVACAWCLMLISSVKAYEFGNIVIVASALALTSILNSFVELIFNRNKKEFIKKLIISFLIIIGIILVKI